MANGNSTDSLLTTAAMRSALRERKEFDISNRVVKKKSSYSESSEEKIGIAEVGEKRVT
jgi:hypothetical protein